MKLLKTKTSARCFQTCCIFVSIQSHHWWPWNAESSWKVLHFSLEIILHVRIFMRLTQTVVLPMNILQKVDWIIINFFSRFYSLSLGFLPVISANIWINLGQFCKYAYKMLVEQYRWVATSLLCKQSVIRNLQIPKHCTGVENRVANLSTFWR